MVSVGDQLADRYRLDEPVGAGGAGDVWRATDTVLGRGVAVKVLRPRAPDAAGFAARFRDEARTMAALRHPGIAEVYDYGETDGGGLAYLVMAYVDGQPLDERIAEAGRLDPGEAMSVVAQVAAALDAAHRAGIVHRDVKPGNVIRRSDGTAVLVDFGIARSAESARLTRADEVVGTAHYMAPEQASKGEITPATDIYSLGALAYHAVAGRPPFPGDNAIAVATRHVNDDPEPLPSDVPAPVREVIRTAMAKRPADRFPTAAAMAEAAAAAEDGSGAADTLVAPGLRSAVPGPPPTARPGRRREALIAALFLGIATVVALFAWAGATGFGPLPGPQPPASSIPGGSPSVGSAPGGSGPGGSVTGGSGPGGSSQGGPSGSPRTGATPSGSGSPPGSGGGGPGTTAPVPVSPPSISVPLPTRLTTAAAPSGSG